MDKIKTIHNGETIEFSETADKWFWENYSNESLSKVKAYIDRAKKQTMDPIPAILKSGWGDVTWKEVRITSIVGNEAWVMDGKKRSKERLSNLYKNTPENAEHISRYKILEAKIDELEAEKQKELDKMISLEDESY